MKHLYRVTSDAWIDGRLYVAGEQITMTLAAAKYWLLSGVFEETELPTPPAPADEAKPARKARE